MSAKDLNQIWLEKMLSSSLMASIRIENYEIKFPSRLQGFLSDIFFVDINYIINGLKKNSNLVFKLLPSKKELADFVENGSLAEREVKFYKFSSSDAFQRVWKASSVEHLIPKVLYADVNKSAVTIVMDDLRDHNYELVITRDGSSLKETIAIARSAGLVHAAGVSYHQEHGCFPVPSRENTDFYDQFLIPNLKTLAKIYSHKPISTVFSELEFVTKEMRATPDRHPLFNTVIHGDLWAGQSLFSPNREEVCLIDWQFCTSGNPVIDLQALFFMSTDPQVLEESLDEILSEYWSSFSGALEKESVECPVSWQQFRDNVERLWIYGFVFLAASIHDFLDGDSISNKRINGYLDFLAKRNVFHSFLKTAKEQSS
ncbi:Protein of unknown function DUF227 [Trinorchestia longiramus]|nr:Protein of unknown function DUF227 [Trinorchestia longiramus]